MSNVNNRKKKRTRRTKLKRSLLTWDLSFPYDLHDAFQKYVKDNGYKDAQRALRKMVDEVSVPELLTLPLLHCRSYGFDWSVKVKFSEKELLKLADVTDELRDLMIRLVAYKVLPRDDNSRYVAKGENDPVLCAPDGSLYMGTAKEVRDSGMFPRLREALAWRIRCERNYLFGHGQAEVKMQDLEWLRLIAATRRREALIENRMLQRQSKEIISEYSKILIAVVERNVGLSAREFVNRAILDAFNGLRRESLFREFRFTRYEEAALDPTPDKREYKRAVKERRMRELEIAERRKQAALEAQQQGKYVEDPLA